MKKINIFTCIFAAALMCGSMFSCSKNETVSKNPQVSTQETTAAEKSNEIEMVAEKDPSVTTKSPDEPTEAAPEFDNAVEAKSGDAFLAINDNDWWIQYWGEEKDPLSYDAEVAHIDENGEYTVSVTTDTDGYRYATTGDLTDTLTPNGIGFAAVVIKDGEQVFPDAVINITGIKVDGKEIELKKKSYTNIEEGSIRSNIFNEWISDDALPSDARTEQGALFEGGAPSAVNDGSYSAQLINKDDFKEWSKIEVSFTVSGIY